MFQKCDVEFLCIRGKFLNELTFCIPITGISSALDTVKSQDLNEFWPKGVEFM